MTRSLCLGAGSIGVVYGSTTVNPAQHAKAIELLTYLGIAFCAAMLIIGALAAIVENAPVVRIYGGLTCVMAAIVGHTLARRIWPKKTIADGMNEWSKPWM